MGPGNALTHHRGTRTGRRGREHLAKRRCVSKPRDRQSTSLGKHAARPGCAQASRDPVPGRPSSSPSRSPWPRAPTQPRGRQLHYHLNALRQRSRELINSFCLFCGMPLERFIFTFGREVAHILQVVSFSRWFPFFLCTLPWQRRIFYWIGWV